MGVRILLVDDHKIMRDGLRAVLEKESDFQIVAEAANGNEAVEKMRALSPDIVIMDVAMGEMNGIDATAQIRKEFPAAKIMALTMHADKSYLTRMLRAGSTGYLLKDCASEELVKAVRDVLVGKRYLSSDMTSMILDDYIENGTPAAESVKTELNPRETEFLRLLAEGLSARDIADKLQVSIKTIERSRTQLMEKLQLFSVAELTKYAIRTGISPLG